MDQNTLGTSDYYRASVFPALLYDPDGVNAVYGNLTPAEHEAVARVQDQFHSKEELRDFIRGLRE